MWAAEDPRPTAAASAPTRPGFVLLPAGDQPQGDLALEQALLERAATGGAFAAIWECRPALVVPATYRRFERFELLCERFTAQGWPVSVRRSGGGLVPQGPGMVNLSLAWRTRCRMAEAMEPVYRGLCGLLQEAFEAFGLEALAQPVEGSFCDGRFNLALDGRKVVGTAQYWKRANAEEHVVLAHACVLVDADLPLLVAQANAFEAQLGSDRQYRVEAVANLVSGLDGKAQDGQRHGLTAASFAERLTRVARGSAALC